MAGQAARPLNGTFNRVPVLHSNQPEEVAGPGILINTAPGSAYASETGQPLRNAEFTFDGEFGLHAHHKYFPPYRAQIVPGERRTELTLATILINPGNRNVHIRFERGAVRNSFEAPYLGTHKMGVRPLGPRPWNTGPGDATTVQMLRGQLDRRLANEITIPARGRVVLFQTQLPALGIATALLKGRSDGPFQMAVIAASNPQSDADLYAVLDQGVLAPGRTYLSQLQEIQTGQVFSRVGGVALGDAYQARLSHDLSRQGPLHVPFTSTNRTNFGTGDIQVNPLASRMIDSSLDNVGTYGVRFDVDLDLQGNGPYELVLSHPTANGEEFTAFRGSIGIETADGYGEVHAGLRSGQSASLASLNLNPSGSNRVRVSIVYPPDSTPGHLLSVVPAQQLADLRERERQLELARAAAARPAAPAVPPPAALAAPQPAPAARPAPRPAPVTKRAPAPQPKPVAAPAPKPAVNAPPLQPPPPVPAIVPSWLPPLPPIPPPLLNQSIPGDGAPPASALLPPGSYTRELLDRYQKAAQAQQRFLREMMGR
jgi:hypothetical protein